jgi:hypothetical protein
VDTRALEARHRLLVRAGIGLLLVLSIAPSTGHVGEFAAPIVERCRELFAYCTLVLRAAGAPLHWAPLAVLAAGLSYAVVDRLRLAAKTSRVLAAHGARRVRVEEPVGCLAREFGVERRARVLIGLAPNPAFTAGLLRPRIYVSAELQQALTPAELRAVFRHELYHLVRRDPLRFATLRFASKTLFWLPLVGLLAEELMEDAEIMADDFAAARRGGSDPLDVASALVKIGRANATVLAGMPAIGGFRMLDRRVRRLADEPVPVSHALPRRPILLSAAGICMLWLSSTFVSGPVAAGMTMQWSDRCPHSMAGAHGRCPECDTYGEPMRNCPDRGAEVEGVGAGHHSH